jgi:hypothetical protein
MEQAMTSIGLHESAARRVAVIAGATAVVVIALVCAKPFYSTMTEPNAASSAGVSSPVANQEPTIEKASFVTSPATETDPRFFFGAGDNSNGYFAERPEPKRDLVR